MPGIGTSLVVQQLRICPPLQGTRLISGLGRSHMPQGNKAHVPTTTEPVL